MYMHKYKYKNTNKNFAKKKLDCSASPIPQVVIGLSGGCGKGHGALVEGGARVHDLEEGLELLEGDDPVAVRVDAAENVFELTRRDHHLLEPHDRRHTKTAAD
jgi:hypothetical protein